MKNLLLTLLIVAFHTFMAFSQSVPQGMRYQAVARDEAGKTIDNETIMLQISLRAGEKGDVLYTERHEVTTNQLGLFSITVGEGKALKGEFASIPWSLANIWLDIDMNEAGGKIFTNINSSQLLTVPYAFHAGTAGNYSGMDDPTQKNGLQFYWSTTGNLSTLPGTHYVGTRDYKDFIFKTNDLQRMAITKDGLIEIDGSLDVGVNLSVGNNAFIGNDLRVDRDASVGRDLLVERNGQFEGNLEVDGTMGVDGITTLRNTTESTNKDNGSLIVEGGVGIEKNINIGGNSNVTGNTTVGGNSTVTGNSIVNGTTGLNGQVTISANVGGGDASYGAYPLRVQGSAQGIAIQLAEGVPDNDNNFVTFFNSGGGAIGSIQGETLAEKTSSPEYIFESAILIADEAAAIANVVLALIPIVTGGFIANTGPCGPCIAITVADLAVASANLALFYTFEHSGLGVTYASGSADYAEWLERLVPAERISASDIVGVYGGKVSKNTSFANQFMVISTKPAILGNVPGDGNTQNYEKVAFMGQIPVKVRGSVLVGDYILPSGLNDGYGIAVAPDKIKPSQYREIVGVAWSGSIINNGEALINMAIGLNNNDIARLAEQQEAKIIAMEKKMASFEERFLALEGGKPVSPVIESNKAETQLTEIVAVKPTLSREQLALSYMPAVLTDEMLADGMQYLRDKYKAKGIDVKKYPGLDKLLNDAEFQKEILIKTKANYENTYQHIMGETRN
jgi:acetyltransferase-like isoleucine patch superfamily enzyme